jgi:predicted lipid carrier protein YhbT
LPLFLLQPVLRRIVRRIAERYPELLDRLGPHRATGFVIDPTDAPFVLYLKPDPADLVLRACSRAEAPEHEARIAARLFDLVALIDGGGDGDAMFFSRDLEISGNTEAVVSLRNAIDNVEGSIAGAVAEMFGLPGRAALAVLRSIYRRPGLRGSL